MDVVHERAAGMDISKRDAKVAIRVPGKRAGTFTTSVTTWGATVPQILELVEFLHAQQVTTVVMEATGDYWKPFYFLMEDTLPVMLVNARQARNIPGRKTDVSDAAWLAQLAAHGLLRASFVPPEPIRQLRDLTRARAVATRDRTRQVQRLEKFLESTGIKLSSVASALTGASARAMLDALVAGERDPQTLAQLAKGTMRNKIPQLVDALQGRFTEHHAFMVGEYLIQIDTQTGMIDRLTARIEDAMVPFRPARDVLITIPGVSVAVADVIIAETGGDMTVFDTPGRLASWAGVCPGQNESAGRVKSTTHPPRRQVPESRARHGRAIRVPHQGHLPRRQVPAHRRTPRAPQSRRRDRAHHPRRGLAHAPKRRGIHRPRRRVLQPSDPDRAKNKAIRQLRNLGYDVTITPAAA